jgi:hypothetical protein
MASSLDDVPEVIYVKATFSGYGNYAAASEFYVTQVQPSYNATLRTPIVEKDNAKAYAKGVYDIITKVVDRDTSSYTSNNPRFFDSKAYIIDKTTSPVPNTPLSAYLTDMYRLINNEYVQFKHYGAKLMASVGGEGNFVFSTATYSLTSKDVGITPAHTSGAPKNAALAVYPLKEGILAVDPKALSYTGLEFQSTVYTPYDLALRHLSVAEAFIQQPGREIPTPAITPAPSDPTSFPGNPVDFAYFMELVVMANRTQDPEMYVELVEGAKKAMNQTSTFEIAKPEVIENAVHQAQLWNTGWDKFYN